MNATELSRQAGLRVREEERTPAPPLEWHAADIRYRAHHFVITNCTTGMTGVVKVKRSTAPGSATAVTGTAEVYAWLGTDAFLGVDMACWAIPCAAVVSDTAIPWLILDLPVGAAHWAEAASGDLATTQDNPSAATLCDG